MDGMQNIRVSEVLQSPERGARVTARQKKEQMVREFKANGNARCSKVLKSQIDRSDSQLFQFLLGRCEILRRHDRYSDEMVASLNRIRRLVAESDEVAALMESDENLAERYDVVLFSFGIVS